MKIYPLNKKSASIFDRFRRNPKPETKSRLIPIINEESIPSTKPETKSRLIPIMNEVPVSSPKTDSKPEEKIEDKSLKPSFVPREKIYKKDEKDVIISRFKGEENWSENLRSAYNVSVDKGLLDGIEERIKNIINSLIESVISEVCDKTKLNFLPIDKIPEELLHKIENIIGNNLRDFIIKIIKDREKADDLSQIAYKNINDQLITLISGDFDIRKKIHEYYQQEQKELERKREEFEREKEAYLEQKSQREAYYQSQLDKQHAYWQERTGIKPTSSIRIEDVKTALTKKRDEFNEVVDRALASYENGINKMKENSKLSKNMAFMELSRILEERFRTRLDF